MAYTLENVWEVVLAKLNKDRGVGHVSPQERNAAMRKVNSDLYKAMRTAYESGVVDSDIRPLVKTLGDVVNPPLLLDEHGYADIPEDYLNHSSARYPERTAQVEDCGNTTITSTWREIEFLTDAQWGPRLASTLKKPTNKNPVATIQNNKILVRPVTNWIQLTYIKVPATPYFDYNIVGGTDAQYLAPGQFHDGTVLASGTASRSVEFEWPETMFDEITDRLYYFISGTKRAVMPMQDGAQQIAEDNAQRRIG